MKIIKALTIVALLAPVFAFATTGDTTFDKVTTLMTNYATGSFGMMLVTFGFIVAAVGVAGYASMKLMFSVFGLTLALRFGPDILKSIFSATGDYSAGYLHHPRNLTKVDLLVLLASAALLVLGYKKHNKVAAK